MKQVRLLTHTQNWSFIKAIGYGVDYLEAHPGTLRALGRRGLVHTMRDIYGFYPFAHFAMLTDEGLAYRDALMNGEVPGHPNRLQFGDWRKRPTTQTRLEQSIAMGYGYEGRPTKDALIEMGLGVAA